MNDKTLWLGISLGFQVNFVSYALADSSFTAKQTAAAAFNAYSTIDQVAKLIENPHTLEYFDVQDSRGTSLGVFDIVQTGNSTYPYLAVSQTEIGPNKFGVNLNSSTDLKSWTKITTVDNNFASQPTIRLLFDGSYLIAYESDPNNNGAHVQMKYYNNLTSLVANQAAVNIQSTPSPGGLNDGTPSFREIAYNGGGFYKMRK
jgi:hypothetical protein